MYRHDLFSFLHFSTFSPFRFSTPCRVRARESQAVGLVSLSQNNLCGYHDERYPMLFINKLILISTNCEATYVPNVNRPRPTP